jgi:hypothetical protein
MAAGNTYTQIASTTLGSAASSVTFSSIPGTYTDLVVVVDSTITSGSVDTRIRINGDTSTNYSRTYLYGDGSSAVSGRNSTDDAIGSGSKTIHNVMNYANTTTYKTSIARYGTAGSLTLAQAALWRSTAAVTSFTILHISSTFTAGSTFNLYGVTAA